MVTDINVICCMFNINEYALNPSQNIIIQQEFTFVYSNRIDYNFSDFSIKGEMQRYSILLIITVP